jgi:acetylglutamate kinase
MSPKLKTLKTNNNIDIINIQQVLEGFIRPTIIANIHMLLPGICIGMNGCDRGLISVEKIKFYTFDEGSNIEKITINKMMGNIVKIKADQLHENFNKDYIQVISPLGITFEGETLIINTDVLASSIAIELKADMLITLIDQGSIITKRKNQEVTSNEIEQIIKENSLKNIYVNKLKLGGSAVELGVNSVYIANANTKGILKDLVMKYYNPSEVLKITLVKNIFSIK